jgi:hypothetical protein
MNTVLHSSEINHFGYSSPAQSSPAATFSELKPRFIDECLEINPKQVVTIDILGDLVELPVYTLRRRNAVIHL